LKFEKDDLKKSSEIDQLRVEVKDMKGEIKR